MTDELVSEPSVVGMVERVARALATADGCNPDDPAYVRYPGGYAYGLCWRDKYATKARAAIAAMREPTEGMTQCGATTPEGFAAYPSTCEVVWKGMIDSALAEDTGR